VTARREKEKERLRRREVDREGGREKEIAIPTNCI